MYLKYDHLKFPVSQQSFHYKQFTVLQTEAEMACGRAAHLNEKRFETQNIVDKAAKI